MESMNESGPSTTPPPASPAPPASPPPDAAAGSSPVRGDPEARLADLGLSLPSPATPVAAYVPTRQVGNLLFVSGQIPIRDGSIMARGSVPEMVSVDEARACARQCVLNGLAAAKAALGTLDRVVGVVRVGCFVACGAEFGDHPKVANGASELLQEIFGEDGRHARAAVGCPSLPLQVPVEVEFTFQIR